MQGDIEPSNVVLGEQASVEKTKQRFQRIATTLADLNAEGLNEQAVNDLLSMYVGAPSQHVLRMSFVPEATEVSTTGVSTTEMSTVGVSPGTYSDEYCYQSSESKDGFCPNADWTCTSLNIARTCGSFDSEGAPCSGLNAHPSATISDYGSISGNSATKNEIYRCGPIACGIDAMPLLNWNRELFPPLEVALPMSSRSLVRGLPGRREIHWLRGLSCVPRSCPMSPPRATVVAAYQAEVQSTCLCLSVSV